MSNHQIECQLDLVISLLESLPDRMCKALDQRQELLKALEIERVKSDIQFYSNYNKEINKMMFGFNTQNVEIQANDPKDQYIADQFAVMYNHKLMQDENKDV